MRILLCEDEVSLSRALVRILEHHHYAVDAAYDGEDALNCLEAENYDAVILDVMMPKLDGIEVLKRTRAKGNLIPIIMLTAKSTIDDKVLGLDYGANDYLAKPFDTKELLARLRAITRSVTETTSSRIQIGNITLDRSTYDLSANGKNFKLASKEFQMMEVLMLNNGHIIHTERFFEKIWGYDSDVDIKIVWVYISYLRKKLLVLGSDVSIKAIRGTGYSLEVQSC